MRPVDRDTFFRLYSTEVSYFSAKVRPALRYKRLPFVDLLSTREAFRKVIRPRTGLGFIPVLLTPDDEVLQDTSVMLDELERRYPDPPLFPRTPVQRVVSLLWEVYCDEFMLLPALHYRWSFPESEAKARADFAASTGDPEMGNRFADRVKAFLPMVGVVPETIPAIEAHTRELLDDLTSHFRSHRMLLGDRMSIADLSLVGPLYPHLYLDAWPGRMMRETAPVVCHWIERVNHPDPDDDGEWLSDDRLAPTMRPLLERIGRDAVPMLLDTIAAWEGWAEGQGSELDVLPRSAGFHETRLRGIPLHRTTSPYAVWMAQRPLDAYRSLAASDRAAVDRALAGTGCEALLSVALRHRVAKRGFELVAATPGA